MKEVNRYYYINTNKKDNIATLLKKMKNKVFKSASSYVILLGTPVYILIGLLLNLKLPIIIGVSVFLTAQNIAGFIRNAMDIELTRESAKADVLDLVYQINDKDTNDIRLENLKDNVIIKNKKSEDVTLTNDNKEVVFEQKGYTNTNDYYFIDKQNYLRCLREIKSSIVADGDKYEQDKLYLLERQDFDKDIVFGNNKVKKLMYKKGISEVNYR